MLPLDGAIVTYKDIVFICMRKHCNLNTDTSTEDIQYIGDKICNMSIAFTDSEQVKVQQR